MANDAETRFQARQVSSIRQSLKDRDFKRLREFGISEERVKLMQQKEHRSGQQTNKDFSDI